MSEVKHLLSHGVYAYCNQYLGIGFADPGEVTCRRCIDRRIQQLERQLERMRANMASLEAMTTAAQHLGIEVPKAMTIQCHEVIK